MPGPDDSTETSRAMQTSVKFNDKPTEDEFEKGTNYKGFDEILIDYSNDPSTTTANKASLRCTFWERMNTLNEDWQGLQEVEDTTPHQNQPYVHHEGENASAKHRIRNETENQPYDELTYKPEHLSSTHTQDLLPIIPRLSVSEIERLSNNSFMTAARTSNPSNVQPFIEQPKPVETTSDTIIINSHEETTLAVRPLREHGKYKSCQMSLESIKLVRNGSKVSEESGDAR